MLAQLRQRAPDFRLEDDDDGDHQINRKPFQHPAQYIEAQELRHEAQRHQHDNETQQHLCATSATKKKNEVIKGQREQADFQHACPIRQKNPIRQHVRARSRLFSKPWKNIAFRFPRFGNYTKRKRRATAVSIISEFFYNAGASAYPPSG